MKEQLFVGVPPGQRPLLEDAPCDCDQAEVERFMHWIVRACMAAMENDLCALATSTGLVLCAASLMNPINFEQVPPNVAERACELAAIMEKVAAGIRERVRHLEH